MHFGCMFELQGMQKVSPESVGQLYISTPFPDTLL